MNPIQQEARVLNQRGFSTLPLAPRRKQPLATDWPTRQFTHNNFKSDSNIGIILGERSGGLVDIDLDDPISHKLADKFLPPTGTKTGRASAPNSHWWYICPGVETRKWSLPESRNTVVELRSTGCQTVVGPSIHPSGEKYTRLEGKPAEVDANELTAACEKLYRAVCESYGVEPNGKPKPVEQPAASAGPSFVGQGCEEIEQRAVAYIQACPPAISGQRGHDRTLEVTQALVRGFKVSDDMAFRLLWEHYNPKCKPPWSEKELRHKVNSAKEHPCDKPEGWLLNDSAYVPIDTISKEDVGKLIENSNAKQQAIKETGRVLQSSRKIVYPSMSVAELMDARFDIRYLVERMLVAGQPCILAGPKKVLKTSIIVDLGISLATGGSFLGTFSVPQAVSVGLMTGESGMAVIQETVQRICNTAGVDPHALTQFVITEKIPRLHEQVHLQAVEVFIAEHGIEVLIVDPAYLAMPGVDAGNLFVQGERLAGISEVCAEQGVTLVLVHHTRKNVLDPYEIPELDNIAWSGFAEFARQWILLGRREPYTPGTGVHRLWLTSGGAAGHSGCWGLDVDEGTRDDPGGRVWQTTVQPSSDVFAAAKERCSQAKALVEREARDDRCKRIWSWLCQQAAGATKNQIRDATKINSQQATEAIEILLESGSIKHRKIAAGNNQKYDGFEACKESEASVLKQGDLFPQSLGQSLSG